MSQADSSASPRNDDGKQATAKAVELGFVLSHPIAKNAMDGAPEHLCSHRQTASFRNQCAPAGPLPGFTFLKSQTKMMQKKLSSESQRKTSTNAHAVACLSSSR